MGRRAQQVLLARRGGVPPGRAPSLPGSTRQVMRGAMITIAGRPAEKQPIAQRQHGISLVWGEPQPKWGHCGPRHGRREEGAAHVHPGYYSGHRLPSAMAGPQGIADPCASLSGGPAEKGRQEGKVVEVWARPHRGRTSHGCSQGTRWGIPERDRRWERSHRVSQRGPHRE